MQHVLKMQQISWLSKYIKWISMGVPCMDAFNEGMLDTCQQTPYRRCILLLRVWVEKSLVQQEMYLLRLPFNVSHNSWQT